MIIFKLHERTGYAIRRMSYKPVFRTSLPPFYLILTSLIASRCTSTELSFTPNEQDTAIWWTSNNNNNVGVSIIGSESFFIDVDYRTELSNALLEPTMLYLMGNPFDDSDGLSDGFKSGDNNNNVRLRAIAIPSAGELKMVIPTTESAYSGNYNAITQLDEFAIANAATVGMSYQITLTPIQLTYLNSLHFVPADDSPAEDYGFVLLLEELDSSGNVLATSTIGATLFPDNQQPSLTHLPGSNIVDGTVMLAVSEGSFSNDTSILEVAVADSNHNPSNTTLTLFYRVNGVLVGRADDLFKAVYQSGDRVVVSIKGSSEIDYENGGVYINIDGDNHFYDLVLVATDAVSTPYISADDLSLIDKQSILAIRVDITDVNEAPIFAANTPANLQITEFSSGDLLDINSSNPISNLLDDVSYSISGDARFSISASGIISLATPIDFEQIAVPQDGIELIITATAGSEEASHNLRVTVDDVNEAAVRTNALIDLGSLASSEPLLVLTQLLSSAFDDIDGSSPNNQLSKIFFTALPSDVLILYVVGDVEHQVVLNERYDISFLASIKIMFAGVSGFFTADFGVEDGGTPPLTSTSTAQLTFVIDPQLDKTLTYSLRENNTANSSITTLSASDFDLVDIQSYRKIDGMDDDLFNLDTNNGNLSFIPTADYEMPVNQRSDNIYRVLIEASDSNGNLSIIAIHLSIDNVDDNDPVFINPLSSLSFDEGYLGLIADFNAYDPDIGMQAVDGVRYSISGPMIFSIDSSGSISLLSALDRESLGHRVRLVVTASNDGRSTSHNLDISIGDVNEAPRTATSSIPLGVLSSGGSLYADRASLESAFTDIDATSPNNIIQQIFFTDIPTGIRLSIDVNGVNQPVVLNERYDIGAIAGARIEFSGAVLDPSVYTIDFKAVDGGTPALPSSETSQLVFVVGSPLEGSLLMQISENNATNILIVMLSASNFNLANVQSYRKLDSLDSRHFDLDASSGAISFIPSADYENPLDEDSDNSYGVRIEATDTAGNTAVLTLNLLIENTDDLAPVFLNNVNSLTFTEGHAGLILDINAYDPDQGLQSVDAVRYSVAGPVNFSINSVGELLLLTPLDREDVDASGIINLVISADDGSQSSSYNLDITVEDVNEPPQVVQQSIPIGVLTSGSSLYVSKADLLAAFVDNDFSAANNVLSSITFTSIPSGLSVYKEFNSIEQLLTANQIDNLEQLDGIRVRLSGGTILPDIYEIGFSLLDNGVNPLISSGGSNLVLSVADISGLSLLYLIDENLASNSLIATLSAADFSLNNVQSYRISDGSDRRYFSIDSNTGELTFTISPDYENPLDQNHDNTYQVAIEASDSNGNTATVAIDLVINNINDNAPSFQSTENLISLIEGYSGVIADFRALDADGLSTPISYSLIGSDDFYINEAGVIMTRVPLDYESLLPQQGMVHLTITASDGLLTTNRNLTVVVGDVNEQFVLVEPSLSLGVLTSANSIYVDIERLNNAFSDPDSSNTGSAPFIVFNDIPQGVGLMGVFQGNVSSIANGMLYSISAFNGLRLELIDDSFTTGIYTISFSIIDSSLAAPQDYEQAQLLFAIADDTEGVLLYDIDEGSNTNVPIATLSPSDFGLSLVSSYRIIGGGDMQYFFVDSIAGQLVFIPSADYEQPFDVDRDNIYFVRVQAADAQGNTANIAINLSINNIDDSFPVIENNTPITVTVDEDYTGSIVNIDAYDPDDPARRTDNVIYSIFSSIANVAIDSEGEVSIVSPIDYETYGQQVIGLRVIASDRFRSITKDIIITVNDINEAPSSNTEIIPLSGSTRLVAGFEYGLSIADLIDTYFDDPDTPNTPNSELARIIFTEVPAGDALFYFLNNSQLAITANTPYILPGGSLIIPAAATIGLYNYRFVIEDGGSPAARSAEYVLSLTLVGGIDFFDNDMPFRFRIAENQLTSYPIGHLHAANAERYEISGGADASSFRLRDYVMNGSLVTDLIFSLPSLDFENPADEDGDNVYELLITAYDSTGNSDMTTVLIEVENVNEGGPVFINAPSSHTINEGFTGVILNIDAQDPDYNVIDGVEYSIYRRPTDYNFSILTSGAIILSSVIDYETATTTEIQLIIMATSDGDTTNHEISLTIRDVNDMAPRLLQSGINIGRAQGNQDSIFDVSALTSMFTDDDLSSPNNLLSHITFVSIPAIISLKYGAGGTLISEGSTLLISDLTNLTFSAQTSNFQPYESGSYGYFAFHFTVQDQGYPDSLVSEEAGKAYVTITGNAQANSVAPVIDFPSGPSISLDEGYTFGRIADVNFTNSQSYDLVHNITPEIYSDSASFSLMQDANGYYIHTELQSDYADASFRQYLLTVSANDGVNVTTSVFTINISNINEAPSLRHSSLVINSAPSAEIIIEADDIFSLFDDPDVADNDASSVSFSELGELYVVSQSGGGTFNYRTAPQSSWQSLLDGQSYLVSNILQIGYLNGGSSSGELHYRLVDKGDSAGNNKLSTETGVLSVSIGSPLYSGESSIYLPSHPIELDLSSDSSSLSSDDAGSSDLITDSDSIWSEGG